MAELGSSKVYGDLNVSGTINGRDSISDGAKLDGIESGATADQTASEILTAIKTVDGSGSGLDADLLDGQQGSFYQNASNLNAGTIPDARLPDSITSSITGNAATATKLATARTLALSGDVTGSVSFDGSANATITATVADDSHNHIISNVDGLQSALDSKLPNNGTWTGGTGSSYAVLAGSFKATGDAKFTFYSDSGKMDVIADGEFYATEGANRVFHENYHPNADKWTTARTLSLSGDVTGSASFDGTANATITAVVADDSHNHVISNVDGLQTALDAKLASSSYTAADVLTKLKTVDGAGSGLDADLLDGISSASFLRGDTADTFTTLTGTSVTATTFTGALNGKSTSTDEVDTTNGGTVVYGRSGLTWTNISGTGGTGANGTTLQNPTNDWYHHVTLNHANSNGYYVDIAACFHFNEIYFKRRTAGADSGFNRLWHSGNDGSGSGLDADKLDGLDSGSFLRSDATDTFTNLSGTSLTLGSGVTLSESTDRVDLLKITSSTSGWGGIQIANSSNEGLWSFMTDGTTGGIYDDMSNAWHIQFSDGGSTRLYNAGSEKLTTTGSGVYVTGALVASGDVTAFSDVRVKENIETIDSAIEKVKAIRGVTFNKIGEERRSSGVIAQEVQEVLPEVIHENEDGILSVAYGNMVGLLIEAIKEQQEQIEALKAQLGN